MARPVRSHRMLRIKGPDGPARVQDLLGGTYTVGRGDPNSDLRVDFEIASDQHLSREHCRLTRTEDGYVIENLGANGTYVNGKLIEEPVALKNRDKVSIGNGTTLEFLALTDAERARELDSGTAAAPETEVAKEAGEKKKKAFLQSPWLWGVLGFYGILGIIIASAVGGKGGEVDDPGEGKYFDHLMDDPLKASAASEPGRRMAERMWEATVREHGGELVSEGPHAYYLVERARKALGLMGYGTMREALARNEEIAIEARKTIGALESRILHHYKRAKEYMGSRHWRDARRHFVAIQEAIPDDRTAVRRYATYMADRLRGVR